ncbi:cytosolic carboxypeptidase Nna1 isoform X2 [Scaptodrosophila lebanonensis]|uniref:Cytosolic carboxypeptidase Nna1 isoform X2 n=1 Tax=Drosophila lebanonensis TaxID=7225 RepID=A0A6J2TRA7_DROLE|nr:cytosolic carboxypeptidase Nna1 isoform X2 [Scaptodrosophila lebanonensis]
MRQTPTQKSSQDCWKSSTAYEGIERQHQRQCEGFLGTFLSKGLKTNQLVVNTDEKTLRPIARLKEPRDLFALPKDKDNDCSQQAPRWPIECQVIEERITHIPYVPAQPEPLNTPTGNELKPRPVGEENGIVVFTYSPISAVNYGMETQTTKADESSDESDDSSDSPNESTPPSCSTPLRGKSKGHLKNSVSKMINKVDNRSTSNSQDEDNDDDDDYDSNATNDDSDAINIQNKSREQAMIKDLIEAKKKRYDSANQDGEHKSKGSNKTASKATSKTASKDASEIEDIWKNNSTEYKPASPQYVLSQFGKDVSKAIINKFIDHDGSGTSSSVKVQSKFAVTPIKLPKKNIARLEVAFEQSARKRYDEAVAAAAALVGTPSKSSASSGDSDDESSDEDSDSDDDDSDGETDDYSDAVGEAQKRLTGGADRKRSASSSSVSDTDTLVGKEGTIETTGWAEARGETKKTDGKPTAVTSAGSPRRVLPMSGPAPGPGEGVAAVVIPSVAPSSPRRKLTSHQATIAAANAHRAKMAKTTDVNPGNSGNAGNLGKSTSHSTIPKRPSRFSNQCTQTATSSTLTSSMTNNESTTSQSLCSDYTQLQFSRSAVGGAKFVTNCHPMNAEEYDGLEFESRFESGNLAKAVQITPTYYELYLRPDLYTSRSKQWFYFRVRRTRRNMLYRFSIVNLVKSDSLYNDGMRPVMYSTLSAKEKNEGWRRCGDNICYYRNDDESSSNTNEEDEDNSSYTLTFTIEFEYDDDTVYFAHSYPYTYSDLQDYLMEIQRHPVKSKFCKLRLLCRTLAGNNVYYLTVTAPSANEENMRRKKAIVVSARVHPSETPASWMMKGLMDFITGDTTVAKRLRHKFIFKLVPMLNPDGVIVGNTRNSLTGKDLNRQYRTVIRETYPSIWYTKAMIRRLIEECGVAMYCDMHAHSRRHNIFIYGCENKRNPEKKLTEQVFPLMLHKNSADRFSFESCKFRIQRSKEGTGRIVVWMLGITNSYTIEASFGGSSLGSRKGTHFNTQDYEHMGRAFCETLLDYCDENPNKVKRHAKLFKQIKKIRKREKREQKALKLQKMADQILNLLKQQERLRTKIIERLMREGSSADEPLNIPLSDYSSDDGNCSSSSDNEGKHSITASDLEGPCCAPTRAPPSSPEILHELRKTPHAPPSNEPMQFRMRRMRKVMHELDRIYFTPLFQRKFKALAKIKRRRNKLGSKSSKRLRGSNAPLVPNANADVQEIRSATQLNKRTRKLNIKQQHLQKPPAAARICDMKNSLEGSSESSEGSSPSSHSIEEAVVVPAEVKAVKHRLKGGGGGSGGTAKKAKKKKFLPTEKGKPKPPRKLRIDRNFRFWLANRKIYICRRKKNKRTRARPKPPKKNRAELVRTTLDLPTTDPGSDLHFSTDDEEHAPAGNTIFGAVPPLRHTLLQSDLQRRYIEEIGDMVVQKPKPAPMPPELIVTTPSKSGKKLDVYKLTPRTAPEQDYYCSVVTGGKGVGSGSRRTYSWHNLNQETAQTNTKTPYYVSQFLGEGKSHIKTAKATPKRTVPSNFIPQKQNQASTADELQMKLSLKKKIWTGARGSESDGRPLGNWYKGSNAQTANAMATAAAAMRSAGGGGGVTGAAASGVRLMYANQPTAREMPLGPGGTPTTITTAAGPTPPPAYLGAGRKSKKLEQVDLLNACSQKLLLWQQGEHKKQQPVRLVGGNSRLEEQQPEQQASTRNYRPQVGAKKGMGNGVKMIFDSNHPHGKSKRKSNMMKIAETTQFVTRFARTRGGGSNTIVSAGTTMHQQQGQQLPLTQRMIYKGSSNGRMHSANAPNPYASQQQQAQLYQQQQQSRGGRGPSKFKTGGLVITAVQQSSTGANRKLRNNGNPQLKSASAVAAAAAANMLQYRTNMAQITKPATDMTLETVSLVRKVKTKLKKRKSRTQMK